MARGVIPLVPLAEIPAEYVETAAMMDRLVGDATTIQVFAHSLPSTDFYFRTFYPEMFYNERPGLKVEQRLKQLIRLRLSKRHGCALCNRANEEEALAQGFTQAHVDALFFEEADRTAFTSAEMAVIDFTDQMVLENQNGKLDQALYDQMRVHFSDEQIVEMAMVAAILVGAAKMTFVLDIVPREATCTWDPATRVREAAE